LLNELEIFQEIFQVYALCDTMELLPTRQGDSATAPKVYYLGHSELGSMLDVEALHPAGPL
jgi:hypothetical protein